MLRFWISGIGTIESEKDVEIQDFTTLAVNGFKNEEEAQAYISRFPKYVNAKMYTVRGIGDITYLQVAIEINNYKKVTGEINETGARRAKKFIAIAKQEGILK